MSKFYLYSGVYEKRHKNVQSSRPEERDTRRGFENYFKERDVQYTLFTPEADYFECD